MHDNEEPQNTTPEPRGRPSRSTLLKAVAAVAATGLVGGAGWVILATGKSREVSLEPTSSAGSNPFTPPVGQDRPATQPPGAGGKQAGDTAGLFGDSGDRPSCDVAGLVTNLQADGIKANAWAQALRIRPEDIPTFSAGLNPMVLRKDSSVTEYGYQSGRFLPYPAVLQAGTSVLVNDHGEPTVKCFNGDPLTKGDPADSFTGPAWPGFDPSGIAFIERSGNAIHQFSTVNMDNGQLGWRTNAGDDPAQQARVQAAINARREATEARQKADAADKQAANTRDDANQKRQAAKDAQSTADQAVRAVSFAQSQLSKAIDDEFRARYLATRLRTLANQHPGVQDYEAKAEAAEQVEVVAEAIRARQANALYAAETNVKTTQETADEKAHEASVANDAATQAEDEAKQLDDDAKAKDDEATRLEQEAGLTIPVTKQDGSSPRPATSAGKSDDAGETKKSSEAEESGKPQDTDGSKDSGKSKDTNASGGSDKPKNTDGPYGGNGDKSGLKEQPSDTKPPGSERNDGSNQHGS